MQLFIDQMTLTNFKGVTQACYHFGKNTEISGQNGSGKTTIPDAFMWVLFNKDSAGNASGTTSFHEKPLDENGEEIHYLETCVELTCRLDGEPFVLKRSQSENWVKKRGMADAVYQGNVSTYFINGVELKASEFKNRISGICSEKVFMLIARMSALNNLPWQDRRSALMELTDIDVNAELLKKPEYSVLADECSTRGVSMDDLRKVMQSSLRDVKKELTVIPARIDEARRGLPDLSDAEVSEAESLMQTLPLSIKEMDEKISNLQNSSAAAQQAARVSSLRLEMSMIVNAMNMDHSAKANALDRDIAQAKRDVQFFQSGIKRNDDLQAANDKKIGALQSQIQAERANYTRAYEAPFTSPDIADACPTCGQKVPAAYKQSLLDKAKAAFAADKAAQLKRISASGTSLKQQLTALQEENKAYAEENAEKTRLLEEANKKLTDLSLQKHQLPGVPDYSENSRYNEIKAEMEKLQGTPDEPNDTAELDALKAERQNMMDKLDRARSVMTRVSMAASGRSRIEELTAQQRSFGNRAAELEQRIDLCEKFVMERCSMLEQSINEQFPTIMWKLFSTQINGGIVDCCECVIPCDGVVVPYQGANTGSRMHADLEIINVLSRHYNVWLPLFFDNRESVNYVPPFEGQIITLSVSNDADLKIQIKQ